MSIGAVLLIFAFVCAVLAAFNVSGGPVSLGWAAIALWLAQIVFTNLHLVN